MPRSRRGCLSGWSRGPGPRLQRQVSAESPREALRASIVVAGTVALIALVGLVVMGAPVVGLVLAGTMILGPGAAISTALFPRATIGRAERAVVAGATGVSALVLGCLLLDLLSAGTVLRTWLGSVLLVGDAALSGLLVVFLRAAPAIRPAPGPVGEGSALMAPLPGDAPRGVRIRDLVLIGAAATIAVGAFALAATGASIQPRSGFSQLWLLPDSSDLARVHVGLRSDEGQSLAYSLEVTEAGKVVASWPSIILHAGESWEQVVALDVGVGVRPLEAILERADAPGVPYRRVTIAGQTGAAP